ncbi:MAG TPA: hypothetical protein VFS98_14945 [Methylomirabilota bacterium]|nr:hypothetical protein [Methylomirabilota bacterium]
MIRVCAWCRREGRPCVIGETPPYTDTHLTHGICAAHVSELGATAPQRGPVPKEARDD